MIELYSLMWVIAVLAGIIGFLRGWNPEIVVTAGCVLGMFLLFQFDSIIRGTLLVAVPREQAFLIQAAIYLAIVYLAYRNPSFAATGRMTTTSSILGGLVGLFNGYLIGGTLWYFLDINEYPLEPLIVAPSLTSPSAQSISTIPIVVLSGGVAGTGDFLAIVMVVLLIMVIFAFS